MVTSQNSMDTNNAQLWLRIKYRTIHSGEVDARIQPKEVDEAGNLLQAGQT